MLAFGLRGSPCSVVTTRSPGQPGPSQKLEHQGCSPATTPVPGRLILVSLAKLLTVEKILVRALDSMSVPSARASRSAVYASPQRHYGHRAR